MPDSKTIHLLGGGVGALATACFLTARADWREHYNIVIYQPGWRLGGKAASSRNPRAGNRIEEHGLHVWFGFYENACALLRAIYPELARPPGAPLASFDAAFKPHDYVPMLEQAAGGGPSWSIWPLTFPNLGGAPGMGDPIDTPWEVLTNLLKFIARHTEDWLHHVPASEHAGIDLPDWLGNVADSAEDFARADILSGIIKLMESMGADIALHEVDRRHDWIANRLDSFRAWAARRITLNATESETFRRAWIIADLGLTAAIGILRDQLLFKGLNTVDHEDFCEWLTRHGVAPEVRYSTPVRALYDCCFAFDNGDTSRPNFAAGVALGCALRIGLMYRGHVLYEMQAGMGEAVVAPMYEVLHKRGVTFEFFQRVTALELDHGGKRVARVRMSRQVHLKNGAYAPLVTVAGLPCWPDRPLYGQIVEGDALRAGDFNLESRWTPWQDVETWTLDIGTQDQVVLGISLGALPFICGALGDASADWRNMLDQLPSIQTQSAQLWMTRDLAGLGWTSGKPAMVAAPEPQDVWADMSQLLARETWPPDNAPLSVQYICGPLQGNYLTRPPSDHQVPAEALRQLRGETLAWLQTSARWLWPAATDPATQTLDWNVLHAPAAVQGVARLDAQWLRANIDPSERYVLSPKIVNRLRMDPANSGFVNLVLAGDWTRTAINAGCVEAAVMSGMAASRALCGFPAKIAGEDFMQG